MTQATWVGVRLIIGYRALAQGADPVFLGVLASSFALPAILLALAAGRIADRWDGTRVFLCGSRTAAAGTTTALITNGLPLLLIASAIIGLDNLMLIVGNSRSWPTSAPITSPDSAFGTLMAAGSVGQLIGPPTVTLMASASPGNGTDTNLGLLTCLAFNALAVPSYFMLNAVKQVLQHWSHGRFCLGLNRPGFYAAFF